MDDCDEDVVLDVLGAETYEQLYDRAAKLVLTVPPQCRNKAMTEFIEGWMAWLPRRLPTDLKIQNLRMQVADASDALVAGKKSDLKLSELIISGALRGNDILRTLISAMVCKSVKLQQNRKRVTSSSFSELGISITEVHEAGFQLASCANMRALMKFFGLSPKAIPRMDLQMPGLPQFFCAATADTSSGHNQLALNMELSLRLLEVESNRDYHITFDDTVLWPTFSVLQLGEEKFIIGGTGPDALMPAGDGLDATKLKRELLYQATSIHIHCRNVNARYCKIMNGVRMAHIR